MLKPVLFIACVLAIATCAAAEGSDERVVSRKLLVGIFDGLKAVNKATKVVESHVGNGLKAGNKIGKVVQRQVKEVINADARVVRQVAKSTDKAINAGQKAVVIGIGEKLSDINNAITAPLVGHGHSNSHHGSAAAKEAIKTIKAVEHGKQKVHKALENAAEERQQAIRKATKQIAGTIDHTHLANGKVSKQAGRAINKALGLRP